MRRVTSIDLRIVEGSRRAAVGIVEQEPDFGDVARRAPAGAGEDHVLHARAAHVLERAFAHHPAQGLDEVRLAAAVRPDDAGQARLDPKFGGVAEALEAGQAEALEFHRRGPSAGEASASSPADAPSSRHPSRSRITIARHEAGFSRHSGPAQSTPRQEKTVRNWGRRTGAAPPASRWRKVAAAGGAGARESHVDALDFALPLLYEPRLN